MTKTADKIAVAYITMVICTNLWQYSPQNSKIYWGKVDILHTHTVDDQWQFCTTTMKAWIKSKARMILGWKIEGNN